MQLLPKETKRAAGTAEFTPSDPCASAVLDVTPPVARAIRKMMRDHRLSDLTVPQLRTMALLNFCPDASLSTLADYLGSSLPAASRMIDGLVAKDLVFRAQCCRDRRQVSLKLTPRGHEAFLVSRQATRQQLAGRLARLSPEKKEVIIEAMRCLAEVFGSDAQPASGFPLSSDKVSSSHVSSAQDK
jgi:DNA-binding MarR family transcriptional regulator